MARAEDEHRADGDRDHREDRPHDVVGNDVDAVPDLVETEQFVLDQSVVQLEAAHSNQYGSPPPRRDKITAAEKVGPQHQAGDHSKPAKGVEETVADKPKVRRGLIVEVMPVKDLMEYGFIDKSGDIDPGENA